LLSWFEFLGDDAVQFELVFDTLPTFATDDVSTNSSVSECVLPLDAVLSTDGIECLECHGLNISGNGSSCRWIHGVSHRTAMCGTDGFLQFSAPGILRRLLVSPRESAPLVAFVAPLDVLFLVGMTGGVDVAFAATGFATHTVIPK
jgi:hypothetical protein